MLQNLTANTERLKQTYRCKPWERSRVFETVISLLCVWKREDRIPLSMFCWSRLQFWLLTCQRLQSLREISWLKWRKRGSARKSVAVLKARINFCQQKPLTTQPQTCCSSFIGCNKHIIFQQQQCDLKWHVIFYCSFFLDCDQCFFF